MLIIHTILAKGQCIMPDVLQGILNQSVECYLMPITSAEGNMTVEENRTRNWIEANRHCNEDIFIGMDSDVVLTDKDAIETLIRELKKGEFDIITLPTKESQSGEDKAHAIFAIWKNKFSELKINKDSCFMCRLIGKLKFKCLYNKRQEECDRNPKDKIIIRTTMADGQCIMPRVMEGILNQSVECCLMPITNRRDWSKDRRYNIAEGWTEASRCYYGDIFVGMDSDVVLTHPDAIKTLIERLKEDVTMTIISAKPPSNYRERLPPHQLLAVRIKDFPSFEGMKLEDLCLICQAIIRMKKQDKKVELISEIRLEECARKFVMRRIHKEEKPTIGKKKIFMRPTVTEDQIKFHKFYYNILQKNWAQYLGIKSHQYPSDNWIMQEIICEIKPDFIIETGTGEGGTALFYATVLEKINNGKVITIDARPYNPKASEFKIWEERIEFIRGNSISPEVIDAVAKQVKNRVLVTLDSNHRKEHVLKELKLYAPLVSLNSYIVVQDTHLGGHPNHHDCVPDEGPWEAVEEFLKTNKDFEIDRTKEKYFVTQNPSGFLKRISKGG